MPSKILLILTEFPPRVGGMQTHAYYLSRHLAERGHTVMVVTYRPVDRDEAEAVARFDPSLGFPVRRILSRLSFWYNLNILLRLGRDFQPMLVYSSTVYYGQLGLWLGVPVVSRSVGNDVLRPWIGYPFRFGSRLFHSARLERVLFRWFQDVKSPDWLDALFRERRRTLMERSLRATTHVIANSEFTARIVGRVGIAPRRIGVLVGGVDYRAFARRASGRMLRQRLGVPDGAFVMLTVCRLVAKKGIDFLLQAFAELKESMLDAHLVIVGHGPHYGEYRRIAGDLGIDGSVSFKGRIPHHEVARYYWASDCFVLASRESIHPRLGLRDAETMGRVLCEANAAGIPVVASRCGGIPSVVNHGGNGLLYDPGDVADFMNCITMIRTDKALKKKLVIEGRRMARRCFDWPVILDAHERIFSTLVRNGDSLAN